MLPSGTVVNDTAPGLMYRSWPARATTLSRRSTLIADVAAERNLANLTGLARVPELVASAMTEEIS